ncbi:MAG: hypothetical protein HYZ37_15170 [Candidatus Solibacter usitatus]|nr:hypothetical protein [Candidatus Solibacter usitatus]
MSKLVLALTLSAIGMTAAEANLTQQEADDIVKKFAAKESAFAKARENYTYRQTVRVQELDASNNLGGKHEMVSDIIFTSDGKRTERVVRAPVSTLRTIQISPEDEADLRNVQPFVLTSNEVDSYHVRYLGKESIDEIGCYLFAVKPKRMETGKRYFSGIIYVDDRDLQIVKSYGRATGILKKKEDQQFPKFETYREQIDGKYWFPTYTVANDTLMFQSGPQPIRMTVKYEDYKQFKSDVIIKFEDQEAKPQPKKP